MTKSTKRYTTAEEIIRDIDKCYERSQAFYKLADEMDQEADRIFKTPIQLGHHEEAKGLREMAKAKRTRAFNLVHKKAKYLGGKASSAPTPCQFYQTTRYRYEGACGM